MSYRLSLAQELESQAEQAAGHAETAERLREALAAECARVEDLTAAVARLEEAAEKAAAARKATEAALEEEKARVWNMEGKIEVPLACLSPPPRASNVLCVGRRS